MFLTSYLAEVDVTHGNNSSIIVIDTRAARANHLQAVAFRSPHGAVLNYDEGDADYGLFEHVKIRDKAAYNRVNEHRGNPWLIARYVPTKPRSVCNKLAFILDTSPSTLVGIIRIWALGSLFLAAVMH